MRRRKQRNPLLLWILGISIGAHIIALPILAYFGAFKKIQHQFLVGDVQMVTLPPPPREKPPEMKKQAKAKLKASSVAKKANVTSAHQQRTARASNLNQPKIATAVGNGGDATGGGAESGTGKAGDIPTPKTDVTQPTVKATEPMPKVEDKTPVPVKETETTPKVADTIPKPKVTEPIHEPTPVPVPHVPVFTAVTQTFAPQPSIPDDLRAQAIDKTVIVEITVDENGNATDVKLTQPTGNDELDRLALDTARKWKFKPATRDGQAVESRVRLHIEFQVS